MSISSSECRDSYVLTLRLLSLLQTESRSKREKDGVRDDRDYDPEVLSSRDDRETRDRRDPRERGRDAARDNRDAKDSRESRTETRSSRESLERREREREKERGREKERERGDAYRKEDPAQDERVYGRGHGRDDGGRAEVRMDSRTDRGERNERGRGRANEPSDKGKCSRQKQETRRRRRG